MIRLYITIGIILTAISAFVWLRIENVRLQEKVKQIEAQAKHDIAKAHINEIDMTLAEKLKNIKDKNVSIEDADYNGSWSDDFGL